MTSRILLAAIGFAFSIAIHAGPASAGPEDRVDSIYTGTGYVRGGSDEARRVQRAPTARYLRAVPVKDRSVKTTAAPARSGQIKAATGARAQVNPRYADRFQCLVGKLEATGYRIDFMGGYGQRDFAYSLHPEGKGAGLRAVAWQPRQLATQSRSGSFSGIGQMEWNPCPGCDRAKDLA